MTDAFDQSWRAQFQENFGSEGTMTECNDELMSLEELNVANKAPLLTPATLALFKQAVRIAHRLKAENEEHAKRFNQQCQFKVQNANRAAAAEREVVRLRAQLAETLQLQEERNRLQVQNADLRDQLAEALEVMELYTARQYVSDKDGGQRARDFLAKHNTDEVGSGR